MTTRWSLEDLTYHELALGSSDHDGLRWFFLLGWMHDSPTVAEWDGASLRVSGNLLDAVSLAVHVDEALADCATSEDNHSASLSDTPERALITLTECCDRIYALETRDEAGRRRSW